MLPLRVVGFGVLWFRVLSLGILGLGVLGLNVGARSRIRLLITTTTFSRELLHWPDVRGSRRGSGHYQSFCPHRKDKGSAGYCAGEYHRDAKGGPTTSMKSVGVLIYSRAAPSDPC